MGNLLCHKCGRTLVPGEGDWYVVRIEAFADPTPPNITRQQLEDGFDFDAEFRKLIESMRGLSERDLMDQVYRKLALHLCRPCYDRWIENPTG